MAIDIGIDKNINIQTISTTIKQHFSPASCVNTFKSHLYFLWVQDAIPPSTSCSYAPNPRSICGGDRLPVATLRSVPGLEGRYGQATMRPPSHHPSKEAAAPSNVQWNSEQVSRFEYSESLMDARTNYDLINIQFAIFARMDCQTHLSNHMIVCPR